MLPQVLLQLHDVRSLLSLYVEIKAWDDAFHLLHAHPGE